MRAEKKALPWYCKPPDFVTDVMRIGPFWFSALKFDVRTLNSWRKSEFGLTGVSQLQPGDKIECGVDGVGTLKVNIGKPEA